MHFSGRAVIQDNKNSYHDICTLGCEQDIVSHNIFKKTTFWKLN